MKINGLHTKISQPYEIVWRATQATTGAQKRLEKNLVGKQPYDKKKQTREVCEGAAKVCEVAAAQGLFDVARMKMENPMDQRKQCSNK